jgi:hypothetical protein
MSLSSFSEEKPVLSSLGSTVGFASQSHNLPDFNELFRQFADTTRLRPPIALYTGVRILTHFPSASPLGLSLGPD